MLGTQQTRAANKGKKRPQGPIPEQAPSASTAALRRSTRTRRPPQQWWMSGQQQSIPVHLSQQQVGTIITAMQATEQTPLEVIPGLKAAYYDALQGYLTACPHAAAQNPAARHQIMSLFVNFHPDTPSAEEVDQRQIDNMTADFCRTVLEQVTSYLPSKTPLQLEDPESRCRSRRRVADSVDK